MCLTIESGRTLARVISETLNTSSISFKSSSTNVLNAVDSRA